MPPADKKWDANAERDLCVAVIMGAMDGDRMRYNWSKVHSSMEALGYAFTKEAISQHFTKTIMRDFKARHGDSSASGSPAPLPKTPKKPTPRKRTTPAKGSKKKVGSEQEDDHADETAVESPLPKKLKRKKEEEDEEDVKLGQPEAGHRKRERSTTADEHVEDFTAWLAAGNAA
ncbi:hypothetical protein F66182_9128 [Fusarium sp. NRRL 66182]|nr:hypothetical protein F66182_9128 [Fusarium sp. NRRL 66182]